MAGGGGRYRQQGIELEQFFGARSQKALSTNYAICSGGGDGELVCGPNGEVERTSVDDREFCCEQPTFKLTSSIKCFIEKRKIRVSKQLVSHKLKHKRSQRRVIFQINLRYFHSIPPLLFYFRK